MIKKVILVVLLTLPFVAAPSVAKADINGEIQLPGCFPCDK